MRTKLSKYCFMRTSFSSAIREELVNSRAEVKSFDKSKLQHVETQEKNPLPDAQCKFHLL